jgi:hypothetical protein
MLQKHNYRLFISIFYLLPSAAAHLADDLAPLGLCCKNIIIACLFLYSTYYLLQLRTWLMISPRWGYAAKTKLSPAHFYILPPASCGL